MDKLIACIEKGQIKEFVDRIDFEIVFSQLQYLREKAFDINQAFNKKDPKCSVVWIHTLFSYSCFYGNLEICKYLFSKRSDPTGKNSDIGEGFPLAISILHSQFHISDWLQKTFNIDCSINNSWPLKISVEYGNLSAVKYVLNHNADIHVWDDYALQLAAEDGHLSIVKYLMSKGANMHAENDYALRLAIQNNQFRIAEYLLDHGANPNAKDNNGHILQLLIEKDQLPLAAKAVSYGADPNILSSSQQQKFNAYMLSKKMAKAKKL